MKNVHPPAKPRTRSVRLKLTVPEVRIGQGMDVHRLVSGRPLILGGIRIPHSKGLEGHSDADVLLHAICDAILGACGFSDIGALFPNTDKSWKGADSKDLLSIVWEKAQKAGWSLNNLDCTVLAEEPKLVPHFPKMREVIAKLLHCTPPRIGLKATTMERLGAVGRKEGIFASAVVLLVRSQG